MAKDIEFCTTMYPFFYPESCCDGKKEKKHFGCARIKRYDNTNLNTRTCNYEMDFTILNERCTVSKTKRKQRKFTTINTEKRLDKQETKPKKTYVCVLII